MTDNKKPCTLAYARAVLKRAGEVYGKPWETGPREVEAVKRYIETGKLSGYPGRFPPDPGLIDHIVNNDPNPRRLEPGRAGGPSLIDTVIRDGKRISVREAPGGGYDHQYELNGARPVITSDSLTPPSMNREAVRSLRRLGRALEGYY
jgi:hypothetical protein